jgi:hypothetical protein
LLVRAEDRIGDRAIARCAWEERGRFNLLMLIDPFLGFPERNLIRFLFRVSDLMRFTLQGFHWRSASL